MHHDLLQVFCVRFQRIQQIFATLFYTAVHQQQNQEKHTKPKSKAIDKIFSK